MLKEGEGAPPINGTVRIHMVQEGSHSYLWVKESGDQSKLTEGHEFRWLLRKRRKNPTGS